MYISETEQKYWLQLRAGLGPDGLLDLLVLDAVARNGNICAAEDLVQIEGTRQTAHLRNCLVGNWAGEEVALQGSLSRLEEEGLVDVRDGIYHVKNCG
jgi:hypothetical protein